AVPLRIGCEAILQFGEAGLGILRLGCCNHWDDSVHQIGVLDGPLKSLVAAIRGTSDSNQALYAELIEWCLLGRNDIAHGDRRKIRSVRLAGSRIDASPIGGAKGRAQHVR